MDAFYTQDELIDLYGKTYASILSDSLIPKSKNIYDSYVTNMVRFSTPKGELNVPVYLIRQILSDSELYKRLLNNLDSLDGYPIKLKYLEDGRIVDSYSLSRADLVFAFRSMDINEFPINEQINIASISSLSTTRSCELKYNNFVHKAVIDGSVYTMDARTLLSILTESEEEFDVFIHADIHPKYDKKYILYLLRDFVERERIFNRYIFKEDVYKRYDDIINYKYIDFESLNKNQKSDDYDGNGESIVEKLHIDEELIKEVQKYGKKVYSPIERAIHAYLRLCEVLTYNKNAFLNQDTLKTGDFITPEHIASINLNNNQVVCYEFAFIFAYILKKLGINYTMDAKSFMDTPGYANVEFRFQEYLVKADAIQNIFDSDLTNMKVGDRIKGLVCTNENVATQKKFNELANKVRLNILKKKQEIETFDRSINKYKEEIDIASLSKRDRIKLLLKVITRENLKGVDRLIYQKKIFEGIFTEEDGVSITFLNKMNNPFTLVTVHEDDYKYYVVNESSKVPLRTISKEEILEKLDKGIYKYISGELDIPGLLEEKGVSYAK